MTGTLTATASSTSVNYGGQITISWDFAGWGWTVDTVMISPGQIIIQSPGATGSHTVTPLCSGPYYVYLGFDTGGQWNQSSTTPIGNNGQTLQGVYGDTVASTAYITVNNNPYVIPSSQGWWSPGVYFPTLNSAYSAAAPQLWSPCCFNPYTGTYAVSNATVSRVSAPNYGSAIANLQCEAAIAGYGESVGYGVNTIGSVYGTNPSTYAGGTSYYPTMYGTSDLAFYNGNNPKQCVIDINWWMAGLCANNGNQESGPSYYNGYYQVYGAQNESNFFTAITSSTSVKYKVVADCNCNITSAAYFSGTDSSDGGGANGYLWMGINTTKGSGSNGSGPYGSFITDSLHNLNIGTNGTTGSIYMSPSEFSSWFPGFSNCSFGVNDTIEFWCGVSNATGEFCFKNCTGGWNIVANPT